MRDYCKILPQFWTGKTGRALRAAGQDAQITALYLISNPHANMIGLYYLPTPYLCHETGIPEARALAALAALETIEFARYDADTETVWIPEMARCQIGEALKPNDKQCIGIQRELDRFKTSPFLPLFMAKYADRYHLRRPLQAPSKDITEPLASPFEGQAAPPCKPLRSQEQEQEQEQENIKSDNKKTFKTPPGFHAHDCDGRTAALAAELGAIRASTGGHASMQLGPSETANLSAALEQFTAEQIKTAWRWLLTSPHSRAAFLRSNGNATPRQLLDPKKLAETIDLAHGPDAWKAPAKSADQKRQADQTQALREHSRKLIAEGKRYANA